MFKTNNNCDQCKEMEFKDNNWINCLTFSSMNADNNKFGTERIDNNNKQMNM